MGSTRTGRDIDKALCKKGFRREMDGKHIRYFFHPRVFTHISHGMMGIAIGVPLMAQMARQLHLTKTQFLDLVDCPLDETGYRGILREQGIVNQ